MTDDTHNRDLREAEKGTGEGSADLKPGQSPTPEGLVSEDDVAESDLSEPEDESDPAALRAEEERENAPEQAARDAREVAEAGQPPSNLTNDVGDERKDGITEAAEAGFLEEAFYPPTSSTVSLEVGSEYTWGDFVFTIETVLPRGWYQARQRGTSEPVLVQTRSRLEVWSALPAHPLLPRVLYNGPEGFVIAYTEGESVELPLALEAALTYVLALARLLRFFEVQGQAVLHLDPDGLLLTETGPRLRYPPRLTPIGEALPDFYREGYTAPEVQTEAAATGKEGVYALAALLLAFLTGHPPPPEGPSLLALSGIRVPGLPQLLFAALTPASDRIDPESLVGALERLKEQVSVKRPVLRFGAATTVGLNPERPVNEDGYGYVCNVVESYGGLSSLLRACVADGMGGEAAGERASRAAAETFCRETPSRPLDTAQAQVAWTLQLAWRANEAVLDVLSGQEGGCTFTGIVIIGDRLSLAHVGDTRAYKVDAQNLVPLTKDHSLVNALLANGVITAEEARTSPDRNKILRSLGSVRRYQEGYVDSLEPLQSAQTMTLEAGDTVLLLSDGVWGEVSQKQIRAMAEQHADPQALAEALVDEALQAGAPDNATALAVKRVR